MRHTTHGTPADFPATENRRVSRLRQLVILVLCSGALAGGVLFTIQHFTIVPLIEAAERYEGQADHQDDHADHQHANHQHNTEWKPAEGGERTAWTGVTTVLTGIGFAAILFGFCGSPAGTSPPGQVWCGDLRRSRVSTLHRR